jgi:hypothetical protein
VYRGPVGSGGDVFGYSGTVSAARPRSSEAATRVSVRVSPIGPSGAYGQMPEPDLRPGRTSVSHPANVLAPVCGAPVH